MINIQDIIPFMKKGYVACNENGDWWWFEKEPHILEKRNCWTSNEEVGCLLYAFDIAPADDWTQSLQKVGGK